MVLEKETAGIAIYLIFALVPEILFLILFESVGNGLKFRLSFKNLNPFVSKLTAGIVMLGIVLATPIIERIFNSPIKSWLMTFSFWELATFTIFVIGFTLAFFVYNVLGKKLEADKTLFMVGAVTVPSFLIFLILRFG